GAPAAAASPSDEAARPAAATRDRAVTPDPGAGLAAPAPAGATDRSEDQADGPPGALAVWPLVRPATLLARRRSPARPPLAPAGSAWLASAGGRLPDRAPFLESARPGDPFASEPAVAPAAWRGPPTSALPWQPRGQPAPIASLPSHQGAPPASDDLAGA